jgi:endonuclease/exonuclease/phosphatase family metal-dependent hydrolase
VRLAFVALFLLVTTGCIGPLQYRLEPLAFDQAPMTSASHPGALVVATYNLQGLEGLDGRFDLERVASVISATGADLVALEELGDPTELGPPGAPERLAKLLGMKLVYATTFEDGGRRFGNGILTRLPVKSAWKHELTEPPMEPRCAIELVVEVEPGRDLTFFGVHLGLAPFERAKQVAALARLAARRSGAVLIAGDMNHWSWLRDTDLEHRGFVDAARVVDRTEETFPADHPRLRLDRFYARGVTPIEVHAVKDAVTAVASDHVPLVGRFDFGSK